MKFTLGSGSPLGYEISYIENIEQEDLRETEAALGSGVQSMISGTLGIFQVFRDVSPQGTNCSPVLDPFLIIL